MIIEKIYEEKAKKIKLYPCHVNRASSLGDVCTRRLVYDRTKWEEKILHDVHLQLIFDEGFLQEEAVIKTLLECGFKVYEQQRPFEIKDLEITGHQDITLQIPGDDKAYPCEIKSMAPHIFDKVNEINDFYNPSYPWLQKYPAQLLLYLYASSEEKAVWILKNKSSGALKEIWVDFDIDLLDSIFKKAQTINGHVREGTLPDRIDDYRICEKCAYRHICLPEGEIGKDISVEDDEELIYLLEKRDELKGSVSEYNAIKKELNHKLKGRDNVIIGNFHVAGKEIEVKKKIVEGYKFWKLNYARIS